MGCGECLTSVLPARLNNHTACLLYDAPSALCHRVQASMRSMHSRGLCSPPLTLVIVHNLVMERIIACVSMLASLSVVLLAYMPDCKVLKRAFH